MEPFGHLDLIIYFVVLYCLILREYGFFTLVKFWVRHFPIKIGYNYVNNRIWLPFPYQTLFNQTATDIEYLIIELMKYYVNELSTTIESSIFFDGRIFKVINRIRHWRYCGDGVGDITVNDIGKGIWIYSNSRIDLAVHDVGIFYIHGALSFGSGHMYSEYLSILALNLLQQGFENPGIFIPKLIEKDGNHLLIGYQHFQTHFHKNIIIMADSCGTSLALDLMMKISNHSQLIKPRLAILISPVVRENNRYKNHGSYVENEDFINNKILKIWNDTKRICDFSTNFNNLTINQLQSILPNVLISYGSQEFLAKDIETFINKIKQTSIKIRVDCYKGKLHNWPITSFYSERFVDKRERTIQFYSAFISRVLIGDSFYESTIVPTNINTRDEDYV